MYLNYLKHHYLRPVHTTARIIVAIPSLVLNPNFDIARMAVGYQECTNMLVVARTKLTTFSSLSRLSGTSLPF